MAQNGFWWANIGDGIELPQCDVQFDDGGQLTIVTAPGTSDELLKEVKILPTDLESGFAVKIEKANKMVATFHVCRLVSSETKGARTRFLFEYTLA